MTAAATPLDVAAMLVVLTAVLAYLNARLLRLPPSVALTMMGALASLGIVALDRLVPGSPLAGEVVDTIRGIDFHATLMDGMLSFLLFAGALHVDGRELRRGGWLVLTLATAGVLLSTAIVGVGFHAVAGALGHPVPLAWCLVFGALVSPTDPVAVIDLLKRAVVSPTLEATVAGESLFNDGVGVVVFAILLGAAISGGGFAPARAAALFAREAGGGVLLGLGVGGIAALAMRGIDDYKTEAMMTLAVVTGGYAVARPLGVSGPVAMAAAGILIGNAIDAGISSTATRERLHIFWDLIDDVLNAVLFLLIGLEVVTIPRDASLIAVGLAAIPLALAARTVSVLPPLLAIPAVRAAGAAAPVTLIWGGLRGGISVALALGLPEGAWRGPVLAATYAVVLFAVIVQGGTIRRLLARVAA